MQIQYQQDRNTAKLQNKILKLDVQPQPDSLPSRSSRLRLGRPCACHARYRSVTRVHQELNKTLALLNAPACAHHKTAWPCGPELALKLGNSAKRLADGKQDAAISACTSNMQHALEVPHLVEGVKVLLSGFCRVEGTQSCWHPPKAYIDKVSWMRQREDSIRSNNLVLKVLCQIDTMANASCKACIAICLHSKPTCAKRALMALYEALIRQWTRVFACRLCQKRHSPC